jgi:hypothetical protein
VKTFEVRSSQSGLQAVHGYMRTAEYVVMTESSAHSYKTCRFFESIGEDAYVAHAKSLEIITESNKKTDRKDAESIGKILRPRKKGEMELSISYIPTPEQVELKDICRYREISRVLAEPRPRPERSVNTTEVCLTKNGGTGKRTD